MLNFQQLEMKYGVVIAFHCLMEIEKAAHIQSWKLAAVDPETRLANALRAQDALLEPCLMAA